MAASKEIEKIEILYKEGEILNLGLGLMKLQCSETCVEWQLRLCGHISDLLIILL